MCETIEDVTYHSLGVENELRIKAMDEAGIKIELLNGSAEIFGTEMEKGRVYNFQENASLGVFTWQGCQIKIIGHAETKLEKETLMILNVVLHAFLEEHRLKAAESKRHGPVTMIVGPTDSGKSTLCRFLLNYAVRMGRKPIFVDLDVGQNSISIPGTIGVLTIKETADIETNFNIDAVQVYQFGNKSPGHNIILYYWLLKKIGEIIHSGVQFADESIQSSGIIINTCGWIRGHGYNAITLAAMSFEIDLLCVIGEERLYTQLKQDMPASVKVHYMPKLEGTIERTRHLRSKARSLRFREYFFGPSNELQPYTFKVHFSEVQIFQIASSPVNEEFDAMSVSLEDICLTPVPMGLHLLNKVLGLSASDTVTDDLMLVPVIGFVVVTNVVTSQSLLEILSPQPGPLPGNILIMGSYEWHVNQQNA